ncbi:MAG: hypothetical protein AAF915_23060 [Cyanobacteria bacterium P01_D01_bin.50]
MKGLKKNWLCKVLLTSSFYLLNIGYSQAATEVLVPPSPFKGLSGLAFDTQGQLYTGSVADQRIYRVNVETGEFDVFIDRPQGQADDFVFSPSGQVFYTALLNGEVRSFDPQTGSVTNVASGIPLVDAIALNKDGRLFAGQSLSPDATGLFEIDQTGVNPPRLITNQLGLNAFTFGADGLLYSPGQFTGEIVKINVDTGVSEQVASNLGVPVAVKFNSKGELFALDTLTGQVLQVDATTGQAEIISQLQPGIDNLAFAPNDLMYVNNFVDSDIVEVNTETGTTRTVIDSVGLTAPGGIAIFDDALYVADTNSYRVLNRETGSIEQTLANIVTPVQNPLNISVNEENTIISSWFANSVQRLHRETGEVLNSYTDFGLPYDAIELQDDSILVADCGLGQITQILDESGNNRRTIASDLLCPTGLATIDNDTILVTESLGNQLSQIDLITGERQVIATGLSSPEGVAYHPDGIAIVADVGEQSIKAIDIKTGNKRNIKQNLPIGLEGFPGGPPPYGFTGIALADDTVYVSGDIDNSIRTFKLDKNVLSIPESSSPTSLLALGTIGIILAFTKKLKQ